MGGDISIWLILLFPCCKYFFLSFSEYMLTPNSCNVVLFCCRFWSVAVFYYLHWYPLFVVSFCNFLVKFWVVQFDWSEFSEDFDCYSSKTWWLRQQLLFLFVYYMYQGVCWYKGDSGDSIEWFKVFFNSWYSSQEICKLVLITAFEADLDWVKTASDKMFISLIHLQVNANALLQGEIPLL